MCDEIVLRSNYIAYYCYTENYNIKCLPHTWARMHTHDTSSYKYPNIYPSDTNKSFIIFIYYEFVLHMDNIKAKQIITWTDSNQKRIHQTF